MKANKSLQNLSITALLIAIGIIIPMFSPIRIIMEPASFTLASHVPIFIAMMFSPAIVVAVAAGTTLGFFFGGFPLIIVLRAATHLIFASVGAAYLQRHPEVLGLPVKSRIFSILIGIFHAACEVAVISPFYFSGVVGGAYYQQGFVRSVLLLVGVGSVIHSMVDFEISLIVYRAISHQKELKKPSVPVSSS